MSRARVIAVLGSFAFLGLGAGAPGSARADELGDAKRLYQSGQYFKAARYAFNAAEGDGAARAEAYSWVTLSLAKAGMWNSASYFFIRTLQSGDKAATRRVLGLTQELTNRIGPDLLRKYLIRHTQYADYDSENRSAYLYALGKDALLSGDAARAIGYLNAVQDSSAIYPYAMQLRGTAHAIKAGTSGGRDNNGEAAIRDFAACSERARETAEELAESEGEGDARRRNQLLREADDLENRCFAGEARTLYQLKRYDEADRAWDRIPKSSFVWPDILFEQAWNSFALKEYNRTLGKLVSYKSPALSFVFNSEVDVLRAHTFLMLCLYPDANRAVNEFNSRYKAVGEQVKRFVEKNNQNLPAFFDLGKTVLRGSVYVDEAQGDFHRMVNRFVRGPNFRALVLAEESVAAELAAVKRFNRTQPGADRAGSRGFPAFLGQVLQWRTRTVRLLGGAFVKNSLIDYHTTLISDFEKMAFIKLEMLGRAKEKLMTEKPLASERDRGNVIPSRRDDQYYWTFNGEFWNDELGDYVFGLESECPGEQGSNGK